jgi:PRTRC genetic system protein B
MHFAADYGEAAPFDLVSAILLYGSKERIRLATVHTPECDPQGGPPLLGEGQPVTRSFLETLCRSLQCELPVAFLPEHLLVYSRSLVAWWERAQTRVMFFSEQCDGKMLNGKLFPHPPLLFVVAEDHLHVWALADNQRPTPDAPLFMAPYWNTYEDGRVCHGSMTVPRRVEIGSLAQWSGAFFASQFTHSNLGLSLCRHPEGFLGLWQSLAGKKRFPVQYLLPKRTLRETLCRNNKYII